MLYQKCDTVPMKKIIHVTDPLPAEKVLNSNVWLPLKINTFGWRAIMSRLPTIDALIRRHMVNGPNICSHCFSALESVGHSFTGCFVAAVVWQEVSRWCQSDPIYALSIIDIMQNHKHIERKSNEKKVGAFHSVGCMLAYLAKSQ
ncbi:putative reverse transcriptase zinc-binding domain-containing protein [Helianthus annuus]|nr:putative reverse transcriptase zinc-binding domain-containing protein [Helianthus annuus]